MHLEAASAPGKADDGNSRCADGSARTEGVAVVVSAEHMCMSMRG
jgi:hypothetical protein